MAKLLSLAKSFDPNKLEIICKELVPESVQEEQTREEAPGYLLLSHHKEHPGVLRHMLGRKHKSAADSQLHGPRDTWLLSAQTGGLHHQCPLPHQKSWVSYTAKQVYGVAHIEPEQFPG